MAYRVDFISPWQTDTFLFENKQSNFYFCKEDVHLCGSLNTNKTGNYASWIGGPNGSREKYKVFFDELYEFLKKKDVIGLDSVEPNYYGNVILEEEVYKNCGFTEVNRRGTFLLNLDQEEEVLFQSMQSGLRRNIKRLIKKEYLVSEISNSEQTLIDFDAIFHEARERSRIAHSVDLQSVLRAVCNCPTRKYFVLYIDNLPVACQGVCFNENVAIEVVLAISNYALENKIYAGDLLKWEIIKWCKERGIKIYDFAGVAPTPANAKEKGIKEYKEKWGGKYIEYGIWSKSLSVKFDLLMLLRKIKNKLCRFMKK